MSISSHGWVQKKKNSKKKKKLAVPKKGALLLQTCKSVTVTSEASRSSIQLLGHHLQESSSEGGSPCAPSSPLQCGRVTKHCNLVVGEEC
ncbi:hypothetical protein GDO78_012712 [Eleutherodactylus coqui]|uniref:Uncharacterized protein n=1 Tax=Eleutherodactylus coqui TaxID=57060 RepID=A0A8J6K591_ELECQ|nr:hypothetical protein GDO78_012712 [Eleutherodactylus coqui]